MPGIELFVLGTAINGTSKFSVHDARLVVGRRKVTDKGMSNHNQCSPASREESSVPQGRVTAMGSGVLSDTSQRLC